MSLFLKGQALLEPKSALIFGFSPGSLTSIDRWFYRVVRSWSKFLFIRFLLNRGKSCNQIALVIGKRYLWWKARNSMHRSWKHRFSSCLTLLGWSFISWLRILYLRS
jgi:hypothetical protein